MVVMVAVTVRLEVDVRGELHGPIWKAVRHSMIAGAVMWMRVMFVPSELVQAFHTETLHLVAGSLSRRLGFGHAGNHFGEDAAQDGLTFGIWRVWRDRDGLGGMGDELDNVSLGP